MMFFYEILPVIYANAHSVPQSYQKYPIKLHG